MGRNRMSPSGTTTLGWSVSLELCSGRKHHLTLSLISNVGTFWSGELNLVISFLVTVEQFLIVVEGEALITPLISWNSSTLLPIFFKKQRNKQKNLTSLTPSCNLKKAHLLKVSSMDVEYVASALPWGWDTDSSEAEKDFCPQPLQSSSVHQVGLWVSFLCESISSSHLPLLINYNLQLTDKSHLTRKEATCS